MKNLYSYFLAFLLITGAAVNAANVPSNLRPPSVPTIDVMTNGGFEARKASWTASSANTFTINTSTPLNGAASGTFTATGSSQTLTSAQTPIPQGLLGGSCVATLMVSSTELVNQYSVKVIDGSSNVLSGPVKIPYSTVATKLALPFQCPSSGTMAVQILSSGSASALNIDDVTLGTNQLIQVSQASYFGGVSLSNCTLLTTSGSFNDLAESSSSCTSFTLNGNISSWSHTDGTVTVANMPAGEYLVTFNGMCTSPNAVDPSGSLTIIDDMLFNNPEITTSGLKDATGAGVTTPCILTGHFSYQIGATHTFKLHGLSGYPGVQPFGWSSGTGEVVTIFRYPSQSEIAVIPETINWHLSAYNTYGGSDIPSNTGALAEVTQAGMFLTVDSSSNIPAYQTCTGAEVASGSGCSGTADIGISFKLPAAQTIEACVSYQFVMNNNNTPSYLNTEIVETPNNSSSTVLQTLINANGTRLTPLTFGVQWPVHYCEHIAFTSAGQKTLRLFAGGVNGVSQFFDNGNNLVAKWTLRPITQNVPAPVLINPIVAFRVGDAPTGPNPSSSIDPAIWGGLGAFGFDTHSGYSTITGAYTVPIGGLWHFDCSLNMNQTASTDYQFDVYLNKIGGSGIFSEGQVFYDGATTASRSRIAKTMNDIMVNAGDQIDCRGSMNVSGTWTGDYSTNYFEGHLIR